ncbi:MAG: ABC transporter substrate-binding protein [Thermodesulfobacteriota bacterium]
MHFRGIHAGALVLALGIILCMAPGVLAQDAPATDSTAAEQPQTMPAKPPRAKAPAPKPPAKAGEVVPFEQQAEPGGTAPAAPAVPPPKAAKAPAGSQKASAAPTRVKPGGGKAAIGALLPLTGPKATLGQSAKTAIELAVSDLNAQLAEIGSSSSVSVQIEDTASAKATALERVKAMAAAGIKLIIGPYTDDEVDAVIDFAGKNGIMLLSPASAGPYLAKPGDNLFRFSPSDAFQAEALAVLANQEGCTHLIPIWVGDMYGDELITHVKGQFANLGGQVIPGTRFRPDETKFQKYVADLKAQIDKHAKDKKKLAILVAARGEQTASILAEAAKLSGMDEPKWYGGDDSALRGAVTQDQIVAQFAAKVRMAFARPGETGTQLYTALEKRLEDRLQAFVDTQAVTAYDVVWLAAYVSLFAGDDPAGLAKAIPAMAERFYGASGWMAVNENGDRREDYDFDFWTIKNVDGKYYWVKTARYQFDPGSVKQLIMNAAEK